MKRSFGRVGRSTESSRNRARWSESKSPSHPLIDRSPQRSAFVFGEGSGYGTTAGGGER
jgi:hypothetical protein